MPCLSPKEGASAFLCNITFISRGLSAHMVYSKHSLLYRRRGSNWWITLMFSRSYWYTSWNIQNLSNYQGNIQRQYGCLQIFAIAVKFLTILCRIFSLPTRGSEADSKTDDLKQSRTTPDNCEKGAREWALIHPHFHPLLLAFEQHDTSHWTTSLIIRVSHPWFMFTSLCQYFILGVILLVEM